MKHRIYRHKPVLFCLILLFLLSDVFLTGCSRRTEPQTETGFYFNTVISITVYHPKDAAYLEDCFSLCDTYEKMLSRTVEEAIFRINHSSGEPVAVSEETARLLEQACNYARLSGGKIDPRWLCSTICGISADRRERKAHKKDTCRCRYPVCSSSY
ncbi:MAG: FAD:protein FMN transferase [Eisenbergiella sp.]